MRSKLEFEVKIGLFIFVGLILLTMITFSIGDFFFQPGYNFEVQMGFANGIQESAPVRLSGIEVGEVKKTEVFKDAEGRTKVKLNIWVASTTPIEKDAKVVVNTLGLIGEKYVEIVPGTPGSEPIEEGDILMGYDSVSVEEMTKKGYEIAVKIEKVVDSLDSILGQIKSGQGTVGKLVYDETLYKEAEAMVKDLKANPWKLLSKPSSSSRPAIDSTKPAVTDRKGKGGNF